VVNNSIYHYRKQAKMREVGLESVMYKVEDHNVDAADDGSTERMAQKVLETMKQLKDSYRVSLTLHLIEGYDYEEISEIMDISYGNCRTMISRAKESLRKKMTSLQL
jgi:RNA polymerase sigma-70 factor (ECF subfamily)